METHRVRRRQEGRSMAGRDDSTATSIAKALGWFSIGLGATQLLVPGRLARTIGIRDSVATRTIMRAMGLREVGHGIAILTKPHAPSRVWARVGGDVLDTAVLGSAMTSRRNDRGRLGGAIAAVLGVAALDLYDSLRLSNGRRSNNGRSLVSRLTGGTVQVKKTITIRRPVEDVYGFWRDFQNLPRFMTHLESVQVTGEGRSRWVAKSPIGDVVEWDAELIADEPNSRISWRSVEGSDVKHSGSVRFTSAPGDRGTEVRVEMSYEAPGGKAGTVLAKLLGEEPALQVQDDLHALKQIMETGQVMESESTMRKRYRQHPAQLPREEAAS